MFNLYYLTKKPISVAQKLNLFNSFQVHKPIIKMKELDIVFKKINFFQQNLFKQYFIKLAFEPKVQNWKNYIKMLQSFLIRYLHYNRSKWLILNSFINLILLTSSIEMKRLYKLIIFLLPLNKHKRKLFRILFFFKKILFFLETYHMQAQVIFSLKGKLGQKGDSKKRKHSLNFISRREHKFLTIYHNDGTGKSSRFGHTFLKIKNTPFVYTKKRRINV